MCVFGLLQFFSQFFGFYSFLNFSGFLLLLKVIFFCGFPQFSMTQKQVFSMVFQFSFLRTFLALHHMYVETLSFKTQIHTCTRLPWLLLLIKRSGKERIKSISPRIKTLGGCSWCSIWAERKIIQINLIMQLCI